VLVDDDNATRDDKGRFQPGNSGGPGRPRGRTSELRRAVEAAVTAEHLGAIMRRTARAALEGNLTAAKIVFDRACGKVPESAPNGEPVGVELPPLKTAADCSAAIDRLIQSICAGTLDLDTGKLLVDAVQARLKAIEARDLEVRIAELERAAANVVMPKKLRG
jgi:hypothetical protein